MGISRIDINANGDQQKSFSQIAKYPYEELVKPAEELPDGVDATQREVRMNCWREVNIFGCCTFI